MKKNFEAPTIEIKKFVEQDVICASGEGNVIPSGEATEKDFSSGMDSPFRGQSPTSTGW